MIIGIERYKLHPPSPSLQETIDYFSILAAISFLASAISKVPIRIFYQFRPMFILLVKFVIVVLRP